MSRTCAPRTLSKWFGECLGVQWGNSAPGVSSRVRQTVPATPKDAESKFEVGPINLFGKLPTLDLVLLGWSPT